jgi:hypothetical protein
MCGVTLDRIVGSNFRRLTMLTKTTLAIVAAALLGFASSAMAAPKHHAKNVQVLRASAYTQDLRLSSAPAPRISAAPAGYAGYSDIYCTSCNLGSY